MGESRERQRRNRRLILLMQLDESQPAVILNKKKPRIYGAFLHPSFAQEAWQTYVTLQSMVATTGV